MDCKGNDDQHLVIVILSDLVSEWTYLQQQQQHFLSPLPDSVYLIFIWKWIKELFQKPWISSISSLYTLVLQHHIHRQGHICIYKLNLLLHKKSLRESAENMPFLITIFWQWVVCKKGVVYSCGISLAIIMLYITPMYCNRLSIHNQFHIEFVILVSKSIRYVDEISKEQR